MKDQGYLRGLIREVLLTEATPPAWPGPEEEPEWFTRIVKAIDTLHGNDKRIVKTRDAKDDALLYRIMSLEDMINMPDQMIWKDVEEEPEEEEDPIDVMARPLDYYDNP